MAELLALSLALQSNGRVEAIPIVDRSGSLSNPVLGPVVTIKQEAFLPPATTMITGCYHRER